MIVITDTQYLTSNALQSLLISRGYVVQVARCEEELVRFLMQNQVMLLITDYMMFDFLSIPELIGIKDRSPDTAVLVLTGAISQVQIRDLHNAGIRNVSLKTDDRDELIRAVEVALKGRQHYSEGVLEILLKKQEVADTTYLLTKSEVDIVRQIASGLTTKEIALKKQISFHTVMTHRKNIFRKLGISSSPELVMYAIKSGLIENDECHI